MRNPIWANVMKTLCRKSGQNWANVMKTLCRKSGQNWVNVMKTLCRKSGQNVGHGTGDKMRTFASGEFLHDSLQRTMAPYNG